MPKAFRKWSSHHEDLLKSQTFGNSMQIWCRFYADSVCFRSFRMWVLALFSANLKNKTHVSEDLTSTCKSLSVHLHFFNRTRCSWNWSYNLNKEMFMIYRKDITFRYNQYDPIHHHGKWISHHQYTCIWISSPNTALLLAIKSRIMITRPKKVGLCSG